MPPSQTPITLKNLPFFSLQIKRKKTTTCIDMNLHSPIISTCYLPATVEILKRSLPGIYRSRCFNNRKFSFAKEVLQTEIGHLFEHILLEYLYISKTQCGYTNVIYNGETTWNWLREKRGIFHITINSGYGDEPFFTTALKKTIVLTNTIMQSGPKIFVAPTINVPLFLY